MGKPEINTSGGKHRHRWDDNIKVDFREICWGVIDWINLA
jgi:hypothetical protein